jgi:8-oxo-dGTP pyrophosphatase MutT (NUDIX family)
LYPEAQKFMPLDQDAIYQAIDELRAISSAGLYYVKTEYDKARYEQVLGVAMKLLASLEERPFEGVRREFIEDNWLHMSPAAGAEAVVVREGKILLIKRSDNGLWAVPGGLVEVGETLAEAAERELWEETGIPGQVTRLLGIFDSRRWHSKTKTHLYHAVFLMGPNNFVPRPSSEATEVDFFGRDELPELSPGHQQRVPFLFKLLSEEIPTPFMDMPSRE